MHEVERATLENEPNLGAGDASKCLPGWITSFCDWFQDGGSHQLDRQAITALAHTLIAARVRAERLVKERDAALSELGSANMMLTHLELERDAGWPKV